MSSQAASWKPAVSPRTSLPINYPKFSPALQLPVLQLNIGMEIWKILKHPANEFGVFNGFMLTPASKTNSVNVFMLVAHRSFSLSLCFCGVRDFVTSHAFFALLFINAEETGFFDISISPRKKVRHRWNNDTN